MFDFVFVVRDFVVGLGDWEFYFVGGCCEVDCRGVGGGDFVYFGWCVGDPLFFDGVRVIVLKLC